MQSALTGLQQKKQSQPTNQNVAHERKSAEVLLGCWDQDSARAPTSFQGCVALLVLAIGHRLDLHIKAWNLHLHVQIANATFFMQQNHAVIGFDTFFRDHLRDLVTERTVVRNEESSALGNPSVVADMCSRQCPCKYVAHVCDQKCGFFMIRAFQLRSSTARRCPLYQWQNLFEKAVNAAPVSQCRC